MISKYLRMQRWLNMTFIMPRSMNLIRKINVPVDMEKKLIISFCLFKSQE